MNTKKCILIWIKASMLIAVLLIMGTSHVLAESSSQNLLAYVSSILEDEGVDVIAITVIVPPEPERVSEPSAPRRVFPINVSEGYNHEMVRELIRIYELTPEESPEWINVDSFTRNGYYYQLADIIRQIDIVHTSREHSEVIQIQTEANDLAAVISGLDGAIDFVCEDGYAGVLQIDIRSIETTRDGTRTNSYTARQMREYPHLSSPDVSLIPRTITNRGSEYTLVDVDWRTNTSSAVDFRDVPQTFTAFATYSRPGSNTVSTGYTTSITYTGMLNRISPGATRYAVSFIGTPVIDLSVTRPEMNITDGNGGSVSYGNDNYYHAYANGDGYTGNGSSASAVANGEVTETTARANTPLNSRLIIVFGLILLAVIALGAALMFTKSIKAQLALLMIKIKGLKTRVR